VDDPPFMPLLTELGGSGDRHCYKHAAPNGAINARARPRHPGTHTFLSVRQTSIPACFPSQDATG